MEVLGYMSYNPEVIEADVKGVEVYGHCPALAAEVDVIKSRLDSLSGDRA
jgi:hypothetical protein